jgi:putative endonuclease
MFTVYVIYSVKFNKIYIGQTSDLERRLSEHNNASLSIYTKKFIPWEVVYSENYNSRSEALIREKQLKSSRGRAFIWNLIKQKFQN